MKTVTVAIIGAGRATELHMGGYRKVYGVEVRLKYILDALPEKAKRAAEEYGISRTADSLEQILADREVDVLDICTPPYTHKDLIMQGLAAGKHVICEKPLCGFFGRGETDKKAMLRAVEAELEELAEAVRSSGKQFMYAENFLYAPSIEKAAEIIRAKKSKILYAKGEESLAGSSSPVAGYWEKTGGGTLMRVGCHPLSAILWLKKLNDSTVHVTDVMADVARITDSLSPYEHRHIQAAPVDVEDHATVALTFSDRTKAVIMACDSRLGGSKNYVELYCNDAAMTCNLTMNDAMATYLLDEEGLQGVEISEMLATKCGWNRPFISDEILRGYQGEMQDFMEAAAENRPARSGFEIAAETVRTVYRAYAAAQK